MSETGKAGFNRLDVAGGIIGANQKRFSEVEFANGPTKGRNRDSPSSLP